MGQQPRAIAPNTEAVCLPEATTAHALFCTKLPKQAAFKAIAVYTRLYMATGIALSGLAFDLATTFYRPVFTPKEKGGACAGAQKRPLAENTRYLP